MGYYHGSVVLEQTEESNTELYYAPNPEINPDLRVLSVEFMNAVKYGDWETAKTVHDEIRDFSKDSLLVEPTI